MADIIVEGPDGSSFHFPEGTPGNVIQQAMASRYGEVKSGGTNAPDPKENAKEDAYSGLSGMARAAGAGAASGVVDTAAIPFDLAAWGIRKAGGPDWHPGDAAKRGLGIPSVEDLPESVRPWFYGGEVAGGAVLPGAGLGVAGARSVGKLGAQAAATNPGMIGKALQWIGQNPGKFAAGEVGSAVGGAGGAYVSEKVLPGNDTARLIATLGGSIASPGAIVSRAGPAVGKIPLVGRSLEYGLDAMSPERSVVRNIGGAFEDAGENIDDVIRAVRANPDMAPTVSTGSQTMADVAAKLGQQNPSFGRKFAEQEIKDAGHGQGEILSNIGGTTPDDLIAAAKAKKTSILDKAGQRVGRYEDAAGTAVDEAVQAADGLRVPFKDQQTAGRLLTDNIDAGHAASRAAVREAWDAVPQTAILGAPGARPVVNLWRDMNMPNVRTDVSAVSSFSRDLLSDMARQNRVRVAGGQIVSQGAQTTVEDLTRLKSSLRLDVRQANQAQKFAEARAAQQLANRVDQTLEQLGVPGVANANALTRRHYDTYGRAEPINKAMATRDGFRAMSPDKTAQAGLGSGSALDRNNSIRSYREGAAVPDSAMNSMEVAQRAQLNPGPGMVPDGFAARTLEGAGQAITENFPNLARQVQGADLAAATAREREALAKGMGKWASTVVPKAIDGSAIGTVLKNQEYAGQAIREVMISANPVKEFDRLAMLAKSHPTNGVGGMKAAVGQYLQAFGDPINAAKALTAPMSKSGAGHSLLDVLERRGFMSQQEASHVRDTARRLLAADAAKRNSVGAIVDMENKVPDLYDFVARSGGAKVGGILGGHTLIANSTGSRIARKALEGLGGSTQARIVENAMRGVPDQPKAGVLSRMMGTGKPKTRTMADLLESYQRRQAGGLTVGPTGAQLKPPPYALRAGAQTAAAQGYVKRDAPKRRRAFGPER